MPMLSLNKAKVVHVAAPLAAFCVEFCLELYYKSVLVIPESIGVCSTDDIDKRLGLYAGLLLIVLITVYYKLDKRFHSEWIFISALCFTVVLFISGSWIIDFQYKHMKVEFVCQCPDPTKENGSSDIIFPQEPVGELKNRIIEKGGNVCALCNSIGAKEVLVLIEKDNQNIVGVQDRCTILSLRHAVGFALQLFSMLFLFYLIIAGLFEN